MPKRYGPKTIAQAKKLYVFEGWSPRKISDWFDRQPNWQTINNWANDVDEETGKTWIDERKDYTDSIINAVSPKEIEVLYNKRIYEALSDPNFNASTSDSLRKLQKDFREMTDPKNQIPVLYGFLTELIEYLQKHHPDLLTEEFLKSIQEYKNYQRSKLTV
ncbi:MAG: hypothetical protein ROO71_08975 [Balneola sp.]